MSIPQLESPATIADLERVSGKAEIVNGKLVLMRPSTGYHGRAALNIATSLKLYQRAVGGGAAYGDNVTFVVSETRTFSPDAAWRPEPAQRKTVRSAPWLAVEIRSESNDGPPPSARWRGSVPTTLRWAPGLSGTWTCCVRS